MLVAEKRTRVQTLDEVHPSPSELSWQRGPSHFRDEGHWTSLREADTEMKGVEESGLVHEQVKGFGHAHDPMKR